MFNGTRQFSRTLMTMSLVVSLASCVTRLESASDYDRSVNFAAYHTFALLKRERREIPNLLVATRAQEDLTQELQRRGYTLAADPASVDFIVDFALDSKERIDINSYAAAFAGPWLFGGPSWGSNIDVRQYREATLVIDVFDGHTRRPVWRGWAQKKLTLKDLKQSAEPINKAVDAVLATFPPARESRG